MSSGDNRKVLVGMEKCIYRLLHLHVGASHSIAWSRYEMYCEMRKYWRSV